MIAVRNVILSGQRGPRADQIASGTFYTPEVRADAADETLYKFLVESLEGAPTSASLRVWFQVAMRTTGGVVGEGLGQDNFTDKKPVWVTINAVDQEHLLPDGDWPTRMANQATSPPRMVMRRIKGGMSHRLAIQVVYSGGTTPAFVMSCENEVRYL